VPKEGSVIAEVKAEDSYGYTMTIQAVDYGPGKPTGIRIITSGNASTLEFRNVADFTDAVGALCEEVIRKTIKRLSALGPGNAREV
jgi:hypothetical protein